MSENQASDLQHMLAFSDVELWYVVRWSGSREDLSRVVCRLTDRSEALQVFDREVEKMRQGRVKLIRQVGSELISELRFPEKSTVQRPLPAPPDHNPGCEF